MNNRASTDSGTTLLQGYYVGCAQVPIPKRAFTGEVEVDITLASDIEIDLGDVTVELTVTPEKDVCTATKSGHILDKCLMELMMTADESAVTDHCDVPADTLAYFIRTESLTARLNAQLPDSQTNLVSKQVHQHTSEIVAELVYSPPQLVDTAYCPDADSARAYVVFQSLANRRGEENLQNVANDTLAIYTSSRLTLSSAELDGWLDRCFPFVDISLVPFDTHQPDALRVKFAENDAKDLKPVMLLLDAEDFYGITSAEQLAEVRAICTASRTWIHVIGVGTGYLTVPKGSDHPLDMDSMWKIMDSCVIYSRVWEEFPADTAVILSTRPMIHSQAAYSKGNVKHLQSMGLWLHLSKFGVEHLRTYVLLRLPDLEQEAKGDRKSPSPPTCPWTMTPPTKRPTRRR